MSYVATGKSLSDHAVSLAADRDCAFHRTVTEGALCRTEGSDPASAVAASKAAPGPDPVALQFASLSLADAPLPAAGPHEVGAQSGTREIATPAGDGTEAAPLLFLSLGQFQDIAQALAVRDERTEWPTTIRTVLSRGVLSHEVAAGPFTPSEAAHYRVRLAAEGRKVGPARPLCAEPGAPSSCGFPPLQLAELTPARAPQ